MLRNSRLAALYFQNYLEAWVANYEISDYIVLHCLDQALCNRGSSIRRDLSDSDGEGRTQPRTRAAKKKRETRPTGGSARCRDRQTATDRGRRNVRPKREYTA